MAKNDEDTAVLEKLKEGEKSLEEKEPTVKELERAFEDEKTKDAQALEQGASRIGVEADTLAKNEEADPTLRRSLTDNARAAEKIPAQFESRIKEISDLQGGETEGSVEQYVLDSKESGANLEREDVAAYQEKLKTMYEWKANAQEQEELKNFNAEPLAPEETQFHLSIIEARMRKTAATEGTVKDQISHLKDVSERAKEAALAKNESKPDGQKLNVRSLELAALYHDCSKHTENKQDDPTKSNDDLLGHSFHSAIDVGKTLRRMGTIPEGVIKHIEQMILTHSSEEFPEMRAKELGKAKELGQGQAAGDFYLMQPKDESAELLRSADLSNGASIESYKKYFPAHFLNKGIFDGNVTRARQTGEKYFDIAFASFLKSTKDNIDGMKDAAVRNTSGAKEAAKSKFFAEDFLKRPEIQSRVEALRGRVEAITTNGSERIMPNPEQLQEVKQVFDALIDEAVVAYDKGNRGSAIAA